MTSHPSPSASPPSYKFIFLRHGQSQGNAEGRYQGQADYPLTDIGIRQAQILAENWERTGVEFDLVISSPLARARQTAEIIAEQLGVTLELDPVWMERDTGVIEGMRPDEANRLYPPPGFLSPYTPIRSEAESSWDLYLRAGKGLAGLLQKEAGRYLVVSHGAILNMTMYAILGITPQPNFHGPRFQFHNTTYVSTTYRHHSHNWIIEGITHPNDS
jgi:probable phosphoglycerate mutase